jgi:CRP-like cAMP-binding protein
MVSGRVDLVKEIDFVCKNVLPVGLHDRVDRTRLQANSVRLKRVTEKGMYFGEVSIIKDTTRSTSAVAVGRTVVLGIDKEVGVKGPRT